MLKRLSDPALGALNLLRDCAQARPGDRLLIAHEAAHLGYYGACALPCVAAAAQDLGLEVRTHDVGFCAQTPRIDAALARAMEHADIIVFLARLGDQLRFSEMPAGKRIVVCYALDAESLGTPFGTVPHAAMTELKTLIGGALRAARQVRITCAAGTDVRGIPTLPDGAGSDTTLRRFPLSVFQPVPATTFSGRVALCGFLTGTGSLYYAPYTVTTRAPLHAVFARGRLIGFDGAAEDVRAAERHYDTIAHRFGIDRDMVHSWHAGIHPGCAFPDPAQGNYERWSGSAFGNPRILHFHTCGAYAPGEISWNVLDPTIMIDGVKVWQDGMLHPERLAGGEALLDAWPGLADICAAPDRRVGLDR